LGDRWTVDLITERRACGLSTCTAARAVATVAHHTMNAATTSQSERTFQMHQLGWLRAAVLGANDGAISTASLVVGIASAGSSHSAILLTGIAGLASGAISMAAGEYVSVKSQADSQEAEIAGEKHKLQSEPQMELEELTQIYVARGLDESLARRVAEQLTKHDALAAHTRDDLEITAVARARPIQAAVSSAAAFAAGALVPIIASAFAPASAVSLTIGAATFIALLGLGGAAAYVGRASVLKGSLRVAFWGAVAMSFTAVLGKLFAQLA
jgi:vacuolar iron transporter family protein